MGLENSLVLHLLYIFVFTRVRSPIMLHLDVNEKHFEESHWVELPTMHHSQEFRKDVIGQPSEELLFTLCSQSLWA